MNKKGNIPDAAFVLIFLVVFAIFAFPFINAFREIQVGVDADDSIAPEAKANQSDLVDRLPNIIEGIYLTLLILGFAALFMLSIFLDTRPAFFIAAIIFTLVFTLIIPFLANVFDSVTNDQYSLIASTDLGVITFIMQNYVLVNVVMLIAVGVALYARSELLGR